MPRVLLCLGLRFWAAWALLSTAISWGKGFAWFLEGRLEGDAGAFVFERSCWSAGAHVLLAALLWWQASAAARVLLPAELPVARARTRMTQAAFGCLGIIFLLRGLAGLGGPLLAPLPEALPDATFRTLLDQRANRLHMVTAGAGALLAIGTYVWNKSKARSPQSGRAS